jgi:hypothetical protein
MKYLKYFKIFEADEVGTDDIGSTPEDQSLNSQTTKTQQDSKEEIQKNLKAFQDKKTKMEGNFKDPKVITDADLEKALMNGVYDNKKENRIRNKFLKGYESVLRFERRKSALQDAINRDMDQIKKTNDDIYRLSDELKMVSSDKQTVQINQSLDRNRKRLKELKDNVTKNKSILSRDNTIWQKEQEEFKKDMKDEEAKIKSLS